MVGRNGWRSVISLETPLLKVFGRSSDSDLIDDHVIYFDIT